MQVVLWKMHHPCFFDCFRSGHAGGDFRLRDGLFYLYRFGDTVFGRYSDFFVFPRSGMDHCSKLVPWSKPGRYRTSTHTIGSEFGSIKEWTCLRSCKKPEDEVEMKYMGGASGWLQQLFFKARRWLFGLFLLLIEGRGFFNLWTAQGIKWIFFIF